MNNKIRIFTLIGGLLAMCLPLFPQSLVSTVEIPAGSFYMGSKGDCLLYTSDAADDESIV